MTRQPQFLFSVIIYVLLNELHTLNVHVAFCVRGPSEIDQKFMIKFVLIIERNILLDIWPIRTLNKIHELNSIFHYLMPSLKLSDDEKISKLNCLLTNTFQNGFGDNFEK